MANNFDAFVIEGADSVNVDDYIGFGRATREDDAKTLVVPHFFCPGHRNRKHLKAKDGDLVACTTTGRWYQKVASRWHRIGRLRK